jgi:hypothetical protein
MHKSRLGNIVIDCASDDLLPEARFWGEALGCALPEDATPDSRFIQLRTRSGEVQVILQRVDHEPRVHMGIETDVIEAEVAPLQQAGATVVARNEGWTVMQAPSAHRFCVGAPFLGGFDEGANVWDNAGPETTSQAGRKRCR